MGYSKSEVALVVLVMVALMVGAEAAIISCGTVSGMLRPCLSYLQGGPAAAAPSGGCCDGVRSLYTLTMSSRPDRITSCGCIKKVAASIPNLSAAHVAGLPGKCGVSLGYAPSPSINCYSIP